jgi:hypothetical protein
MSASLQAYVCVISPTTVQVPDGAVSPAKAAASPTVAELAAFECEGQVRAGEFTPPAEPTGGAGTILAEVGAEARQLQQIAREFGAVAQDLLQVVGQQDALGDTLRGGVVQDATLEALVDEISVARAALWPRDRRRGR